MATRSNPPSVAQPADLQSVDCPLCGWGASRGGAGLGDAAAWRERQLRAHMEARHPDAAGNAAPGAAAESTPPAAASDALEKR